MSSKNRRRARDAPVSQIEEYWKNQIATLGRNVVFVDTGAILEAHNPSDFNFRDYFAKTTDRFITSPFVVAETVRRMVKSNQYEFEGPSGEQFGALAVHFIRTWLVENRVEVLHIPREVFDLARKTFENKQNVGCDLVDIISYEIVKGLGQDRIASRDRHFSSLGLMLYPSI